MTPAELTRALGGRWHGRYGTARCPAHRDRSPSLSVGEGQDGKLLVKCFAGCDQRQVIDTLRRLELWAGRSEDIPPGATEQEARRERKAAKERDRRRREVFVERTWREVWANAAPAAGSPIEAGWLPLRGIEPHRLDLSRIPLRWSPRCPLGKETAPAMVALMTDAATGEPVGIHRTFLAVDGGAKAFGSDSRKMLGSAGVVRLSPDDEVGVGLGICEGIETGLAVMAAGWRPIWACASLGALERFPILAGIEALTIFADPKPNEVAGARACAARWAAAGREAVVRIPQAGGDWNDRLRAAA